MKKILGALASIGLLAGSLAANAIPVTYDFTVSGGPVGPLAGVIASGYFSFDDSVISAGNIVNESGLLTGLAFTWNGIAYDETTANTGWLRFNSAGVLSQFGFGNRCDPGVCSNGRPDDWVLAATATAGAWDGQLRYEVFDRIDVYIGELVNLSERTSVPEPATLALFGMALAGFGLTRCRRLA